MGKKKTLQKSPNISVSKAAKPSSKSSIHLWLLSGRKLLTSDAEIGQSATANHSHVDRFHSTSFYDDGGGGGGDDGDDICRAYYISKPTDVSPRLTSPPPHVVRASERFFVPRVMAASLVEEARLSAASISTCPTSEAAGVVSTAVITFSKDAHSDFLRSMMEMTEAHHAGRGWRWEREGVLDWEFMEELLFCYLELNERSVHKYILRAFVDLTASFLRHQSRA